MPPRGRPAGSTNKTKASSTSASNAARASNHPPAQRAAKRQEEANEDDLDPFADSQDVMDMTQDSVAGPATNDHEDEEDDEEEEEEEPKATIPPELLTRLLHEFFEKDGSRISKDANEAVAKYMDIFVREAIARAAVERSAGFLDVEDLEKIAPQLLLDL